MSCDESSPLYCGTPSSRTSRLTVHIKADDK